MSCDSEKDTLKRRIEALEQLVERLQEENQSCKTDIKRLMQNYDIMDIMDSMGKLHKSLKKRPLTHYFPIEKFIQNPGFQHISLSIFKKLDPKSLGNCRMVSKEWKACIDQDKYWWHLQLGKCKEIMSETEYSNSLAKQYPEFMKTMDHIYEKESMENLKTFTTFMSSYRLKLIGNPKTYDWETPWPYISIRQWETPLHFAADENRIDIFDILVNSPYMKNMNVKNFSFSLLCRSNRGDILGDACFKNQVEIVQYYMNLKDEQKIDFNKMPAAPDGYSLFHNACDSNQIEVVKLFLDRADELNIDLNARSVENHEDYDDGHDGKTPIMYVMKPEVMKLLLADERIDVNATDDEGRTVLFYVSECLNLIYDWQTPEDLGRFEIQEFLDTITLLMSRSSRFDPTIDERTGYTALHQAFASWQDEVAEVILESALKAGIDVNCRDENGMSPAHYAFQCNDLNEERPKFLYGISKVCKIVLKYAKEVGIDLEARDNSGRTPLHYVCEKNTKKVIDRFLIMARTEFGIEFNLEVTDGDGKTPFELCKKQVTFV